MDGQTDELTDSFQSGIKYVYLIPVPIEFLIIINTVGLITVITMMIIVIIKE